MPVTPTYPGLYIEELPSDAHTIEPAPTSITVFIGYTHPFKTRNFNRAIQLFSFSDYEREFGGIFLSGLVKAHVAEAVNQFFLNGGSNAYVVGLEPKTLDTGGNVIPSGTSGQIPVATGEVGEIRFNAREPTDSVPMTVTINNLQASDPKNAPATLDVADIIITYGARVETHRGVTVNANPTDPAVKDKYRDHFIEKRLGTPTQPLSSLVKVEPKTPGGNYGTAFTAQLTPLSLTATLPAGFATTFRALDFTPVFDQDSSLDKVSIFNLLAVPGVADNTVWSAALAFCERKQAFAILDSPKDAAADRSSDPLPLITDLMDSIVPKSTNGAIYFPYLRFNNPLTGNPDEQPPSGYVAGVYARTDQNRGVWKAPAGMETILKNTTGVVERGRLTDARHGLLNPKGINALRSFPGIGTVVFGARTLVAENNAFEQWRYVPVRRMALFIEQTLLRNLTWVVFEPNDRPLWTAIKTSIENFMLGLFRQGAFQGKTPSEAFLVKVDETTTTQDDINRGIVNIVVGFRPLKPAEFVIIKIAQLAGQAQS